MKTYMTYSLLAMIRGLALFIGAFLIGSRGLALVYGGDSAVWMFDLRDVPGGGWLLAGAGLMLVGYALMPRRFRRVGWITMSILAVVAMINAGSYYLLIWQDRLHAASLISSSLILMMLLIGSGLWIGLRPVKDGWWHRGGMMVWAGGWAVLFAVGWMGLFGNTDYRRSVDAVVVFGARTYADGRPSDALADRVRTGAKLVTEGYADWLIVSGGPGDGAIHETEAMRDFAIRLGVPTEKIILDRDGWNTSRTIRNTASIAEKYEFQRMIFVSHDYHLPRIRMEVDRAGINGVTVPAEESYTLSAKPWYIMREVAAFWVYWARV